MILSAQATDKSVNAATKKLFKIAPDAKSIYKLGENNLKEYIKTIGLYNAKASLISCSFIFSNSDHTWLFEVNIANVVSSKMPNFKITHGDSPFIA